MICEEVDPVALVQRCATILTEVALVPQVNFCMIREMVR